MAGSNPRRPRYSHPINGPSLIPQHILSQQTSSASSSSRPLRDPYQVLSADDFDGFVGSITSRIREALLGGPNRQSNQPSRSVSRAQEDVFGEVASVPADNHPSPHEQTDVIPHKDYPVSDNLSSQDTDEERVESSSSEEVVEEVASRQRIEVDLSKDDSSIESDDPEPSSLDEEEEEEDRMTEEGEEEDDEQRNENLELDESLSVSESQDETDSDQESTGQTNGSRTVNGNLRSSSQQNLRSDHLSTNHRPSPHPPGASQSHPPEIIPIDDDSDVEVSSSISSSSYIAPLDALEAEQDADVTIHGIEESDDTDGSQGSQNTDSEEFRSENLEDEPAREESPMEDITVPLPTHEQALGQASSHTLSKENLSTQDVNRRGSLPISRTSIRSSDSKDCIQSIPEGVVSQRVNFFEPRTILPVNESRNLAVPPKNETLADRQLSKTDDVIENSLDPRPDPPQLLASSSRSLQRIGSFSADGKMIFRPSSETSEDMLEDENDDYLGGFLEYSKTEEFQTDLDGPIVSTSVHYRQHIEVTNNHQDLGDRNTTNEFDPLSVDPALDQLTESHISVTQITQQTPIVIDDDDDEVDHLSHAMPESRLDHMRSVAEDGNPHAAIYDTGDCATLNSQRTTTHVVDDNDLFEGDRDLQLHRLGQDHLEKYSMIDELLEEYPDVDVSPVLGADADEQSRMQSLTSLPNSDSQTENILERLMQTDPKFQGLVEQAERHGVELEAQEAASNDEALARALKAGEGNMQKILDNLLGISPQTPSTSLTSTSALEAVETTNALPASDALHSQEPETTVAQSLAPNHTPFVCKLSEHLLMSVTALNKKYESHSGARPIENPSIILAEPSASSIDQLWGDFTSDPASGQLLLDNFIQPISLDSIPANTSASSKGKSTVANPIHEGTDMQQGVPIEVPSLPDLHSTEEETSIFVTEPMESSIDQARATDAMDVDQPLAELIASPAPPVMEHNEQASWSRLEGPTQCEEVDMLALSPPALSPSTLSHSNAVEYEAAMNDIMQKVFGTQEVIHDTPAQEVGQDEQDIIQSNPSTLLRDIESTIEAINTEISKAEAPLTMEVMSEVLSANEAVHDKTESSDLLTNILTTQATQHSDAKAAEDLGRSRPSSSRGHVNAVTFADSPLLEVTPASHMDWVDDTGDEDAEKSISSETRVSTHRTDELPTPLASTTQGQRTPSELSERFTSLGPASFVTSSAPSSIASSDTISAPASVAPPPPLPSASMGAPTAALGLTNQINRRSSIDSSTHAEPPSPSTSTRQRSAPITKEQVNAPGLPHIQETADFYNAPGSNDDNVLNPLDPPPPSDVFSLASLPPVVDPNPSDESTSVPEPLGRPVLPDPGRTPAPTTGEAIRLDDIPTPYLTSINSQSRESSVVVQAAGSPSPPKSTLMPECEINVAGLPHQCSTASEDLSQVEASEKLPDPSMPPAASTIPTIQLEDIQSAQLALDPDNGNHPSRESSVVAQPAGSPQPTTATKAFFSPSLTSMSGPTEFLNPMNIGNSSTSSAEANLGANPIRIEPSNNGTQLLDAEGTNHGVADQDKGVYEVKQAESSSMVGVSASLVSSPLSALPAESADLPIPDVLSSKKASHDSAVSGSPSTNVIHDGSDESMSQPMTGEKAKRGRPKGRKSAASKNMDANYSVTAKEIATERARELQLEADLKSTLQKRKRAKQPSTQAHPIASASPKNEGVVEGPPKSKDGSSSVIHTPRKVYITRSRQSTNVPTDDGSVVESNMTEEEEPEDLIGSQTRQMRRAASNRLTSASPKPPSRSPLSRPSRSPLARLSRSPRSRPSRFGSPRTSPAPGPTNLVDNSTMVDIPEEEVTVSPLPTKKTGKGKGRKSNPTTRMSSPPAIPATPILNKKPSSTASEPSDIGQSSKKQTLGAVPGGDTNIASQLSAELQLNVPGLILQRSNDELAPRRRLHQHHSSSTLLPTLNVPLKEPMPLEQTEMKAKSKPGSTRGGRRRRSELEGRPLPSSQPPVTRSHCHYVRIKFTKLSERLRDEVKLDTFLVPQCAMGDEDVKNLMVEEGVEEVGDATVEEQSRSFKIGTDGKRVNEGGGTSNEMIEGEEQEPEEMVVNEEMMKLLIRLVGLGLIHEGQVEVLMPLPLSNGKKIEGENEDEDEIERGRRSRRMSQSNSPATSVTSFRSYDSNRMKSKTKTKRKSSHLRDSSLISSKKTKH
ncbi:uncharacterized protein MELLADRAFT_106057 [Melampsora larici-populina 98AG31]|uniref:Uncharacterized protein n=1 Tax=Melampsora larici-populina (strain 98AG31 / pathotype 3-4-7) TaxID=747676 RepID=F4RK81_MELLP|nr:uncharacterized protein MELLADRAFT_106057 [Melampsora larici-populina 98AG31]EGG07053.1 hypothetical protein MELLADRAFT_106057 [Melampsora larici-populina 98AG31]